VGRRKRLWRSGREKSLTDNERGVWVSEEEGMQNGGQLRIQEATRTIEQSTLDAG
jgi:hypothetical protein